MRTVTEDRLVPVAQEQELDTSVDTQLPNLVGALVNGTVTTPATLKNPKVSSPSAPS